ncbi:two-component sensor histidine kinase [Calothrix sp. NIES-4071]|nr:two-component sensor histidine kinase [Calothrix sp. NIES-4071]BAZ55280.1 two-component sensor histidine kinase [Calothrix sp. NIES-4105]
MRYENTKTDETVERLFSGQYEDVFSAQSISKMEMEVAYGLLQAEVLQLRQREQQLEEQLSFAREQEKASQQFAEQQIKANNVLRQSAESAISSERNRIAREIHDTLAQSFTSILMRLQTAELSLPKDIETAQTNIYHACELARFGLAEARRSVYALRPQHLEGRSFQEALKKCLHSIVALTGIESEFCVVGLPATLPVNVEVELLRIAQEAITNTCKHAASSKIVVQLIFMPQKVRLLVQDNGSGFSLSESTATNGFGLISMQERTQKIGAKFSISSQLGQGTQVIIEVESSQ